MRNKNTLFIAMAGTYKPNSSHELSYLDFDNENWWTKFKSRRKIKKQLRKTNVVIQATTDTIKNIKIKFRLVLPSKDFVWYSKRPWILPGIRYMYPVLKSKYLHLVSESTVIELPYHLLLEQYIERNEFYANKV